MKTTYENNLSSFFSSINTLSEWHCKAIRDLCPRWTDFPSFLSAIGIRKGITNEEIDGLLHQIYPHWDAFPDVADDGTILGYYEWRIINNKGLVPTWYPA